MYFRKLVEEDEYYNNIEEFWSTSDLIELLKPLDEEDLNDVLDYIMDRYDNILEMYYEDEEDEELYKTKESYLEYISKIIQSLTEEEMYEVTNYVMSLIEHYEASLSEKMSSKAKTKNRRYRKTPAYKKAMRLKKKCQARFKDKIAKSKKQNIPYVCGVDGKLHKGMDRKNRRVLKKHRKRNKNKITVK